MAMNISSNFLVGVRDFLDSRQRVENRQDLDSINTFFIPDMFIVYCEEEDCYYQYKEATESWLMLDLNINEYLYELDENGAPDLTKPLYIEEERIKPSIACTAGTKRESKADCFWREMGKVKGKGGGSGWALNPMPGMSTAKLARWQVPS